jgi:hypothetical protein
MIPVVADADTLFGATTRGLLIHLDYQGLIRLHWSPLILDEMSRALVDTGRQSDPVRARAVRAIGNLRADDVRLWLLSLVTRRSTILRRVKLVEPTQTAATALQLLQRMYGDDPTVNQVRALLERAEPDGRWQVRDVPTEKAS